MALLLHDARTNKDVKLYRKEAATPVAIEEWRKSWELSLSLGLRSHADICNFEGRLNFAKEFFPLLPFYRFYIFNLYLLTTYSQRMASIEGYYSWEDYSFDVIPNQVLETMKVARDMNVFDDLQIWTVEKKSIPIRMHPEDPVLFGVIMPPIKFLPQNPEDASYFGHTFSLPDTMWKSESKKIFSPMRRQANAPYAYYFGIARWGECLRPFEQIEEEVFKTGINWIPELYSDPCLSNPLKEVNGFVLSGEILLKFVGSSKGSEIGVRVSRYLGPKPDCRCSLPPLGNFYEIESSYYDGKYRVDKFLLCGTCGSKFKETKFFGKRWVSMQ